MRPRLVLVRALNRAGYFIASLPVAALPPKDLIAYGRDRYAAPASLEYFGRASDMPALESDETLLLDHLPERTGRLLLLGMGAGREVPPLARAGFEITGLDYVPGMIERAVENARRWEIKLDVLFQDFLALDLPESAFDVVWMSRFMYSGVPTRTRRIAMLKRIRRALKPGGHFVCQFLWWPETREPRAFFAAKKAFAWLVGGHRGYENGDTLTVEFMHHFLSEEEIRAEFREGGFDLVYLPSPEQGVNRNRGAVLRKPE